MVSARADRALMPYPRRHRRATAQSNPIPSNPDSTRGARGRNVILDWMGLVLYCIGLSPPRASPRRVRRRGRLNGGLWAKPPLQQNYVITTELCCYNRIML